MDIGFAFIFPFLCNIQIYPIFHLSKYSNIQVVVVGRHDIRQVCIGLALKLYVLPFKYSYIQIFIYSNIQMARPLVYLIWCRSGQRCGATINIQWCNRESPLRYKDVVRFSYLKKLFLLWFFSIFGEVADWFQLMFKS